jgi:hypothetical protein
MFFIQPLIGKIITPQYGGVSQVWCLCLLFFQLTLLCGYGFTYFLSKFNLKVQGAIYISLMLLSLILLRIPLGDGWAPESVEHPVLTLLLKLIIYLAIPTILLSTVSMNIQNWYRLITDKDPYHLYSISNVGSISALLAYPILIEPNFTVSTTIRVWISVYWVLVILASISSILLLKFVKKNGTLHLKPEKTPENGNTPSFWTYVYWVFLAAAGTTILISFSAYLTQDIAAVPLLWILPLAIYLLTFILAFSHEKYYQRGFFLLASPAFIFASLATRYDIETLMPVLILLLSLFWLCMICHGELYRARPKYDHLPAYYLTIAFGGALGGIFINIIAPLVFNDYTEFYLILLVMALYISYSVFNYTGWIFKIKALRIIYTFVLLLFITAGIVFVYKSTPKELVLSQRNFYGTVKILHFTKFKNNKFTLRNGTTNHGFQMYDPVKKKLLNIPTGYFTKHSAPGIAYKMVKEKMLNKGLNIGVIGLGAGTLAYYGKKNDSMTFYEIDPKIEELAQNYFSFLKMSEAQLNIRLGDGRVLLNKEKPQQYDILIVDAFTGDAIPVHLLTIEAVRLYLKHIKDNGLILIHITNRYLDLKHVLQNHAVTLDLYGVEVCNKNDYKKHQHTSCYYLLTRNEWIINELKVPDFKKKYNDVTLSGEPEYNTRVGTWSDNYSNLFSLLLNQ